MTVLEAIQRSTGFLARKGVDSPRLQVELLLAHALGVPRLKLYMDFEQQLTGASLQTVRELVRRRGNREPLQHIIGSTSFCGFEIKVNRHVLVPRPETEMLAERAWQFLAALNPPPAPLSTSARAAAAWPSRWPPNAPGRRYTRRTFLWRLCASRAKMPR